MFTTIDKAIVGLLTSALGIVVGFGILEEGTAQQIVTIATPVIVGIATYFWPNAQT